MKKRKHEVKPKAEFQEAGHGSAQVEHQFFKSNTRIGRFLNGRISSNGIANAVWYLGPIANHTLLPVKSMAGLPVIGIAVYDVVRKMHS